jgi:hypothetical protein
MILRLMIFANRPSCSTLVTFFGLAFVALASSFLGSKGAAHSAYGVRSVRASYSRPIINGLRNWSPKEIATLFEQTCFVGVARFDPISRFSERVRRVGWNKSHKIMSVPLFTRKQTSWSRDGLKIVYNYWGNRRHVECEVIGLQVQTPSASAVVGALNGKLRRINPHVISLWKGGPISYNWRLSSGNADQTTVTFVDKPLETPGDYMPQVPAELHLKIEHIGW